MSKKDSLVPPHQEAEIVQVATTALVEITAVDTFHQPPLVHREDGVATVRFASSQPGYPGWFWTVALSDLPDIAPTVLELELLPGEGALLSPDWVPWADRMEEYLVHEKELALAAQLDISDDDDDVDVDDFDDDVDGVDIDQLDLELDPSPLEIPEEPSDVFDHVDFDEPDPLDP